MQFSHLGLPCARCGQNSAAPFPEPTVPCESLLAFLKESTSLRGPQVHLEAGRARIQYELIFKVAMLGEFSPQWGQHAISAEWRSHPVDDLLQYFFGRSFINAILDPICFEMSD